MTTLTTTTITDDISGMGPLAAPFARAGQRLRQADRGRPWVLDTAVVVLVLLLFCLPDLPHHGGAGDGDGDDRHRFQFAFTQLPLAVVLALQAGLVLPLIWRRRRPLAAFAAIAVVFVLQWSLGAALRADIALFVALYSLALHGQLRRLPWACGVMAAGMVLVAVRVSPAVSVWDALFFLLSTVIAALAVGLMVRTRRARLAGLRERAARLETERDQRIRLATATERARVAREMHDIVGHNLSVIITLADAGAYAADTAPQRGKEALQLIGDTGRTALGELRRVLGVLREASDGTRRAPELSPQPGLADIASLCDSVRTAGLEIVYRTVGEVGALDRGMQLAVYRIVQEALTNTLKHAGAGTRVTLSLVVEDERLVIRIRDDGPGGQRGPWNEEGHGLVGMRERAALYGGTVHAGPAAEGGWGVEAALDLTSGEGAR
ncbi:sensor histidine kinase [Streptomyces sp. LaBMicrA B280]|uniref:sensor histidine kinase n=1 Tax=Streptomyces sp. LaBMicrA B280 TaxID=3391001 RepID=UPI003BA587ED